MLHVNRRRRIASLLVVVSLSAVSLFLILNGKVRQALALRLPNGGPQLVSVERLPLSEGDHCEWLPARASSNIFAALRQESSQSASAEPGNQGSINADRSPVRVIRDTYPTYSAIAIDNNSNEAFIQDENLFGIKVFNRMDNTPSGASFTEPKRILGGRRTKLEFNCALYIDPQSGDVYSVANDTVDTMVIFPRDAKGDVSPTRELHTPHGTFGIAVDEENQELFLTVEHENSIVVYRKQAQGKEQPLRTIAGTGTRLEDPHGIAVDTRHQWIFVSNHGNAAQKGVAGSGKFEPPSITVYPLKADGNAAPIRVITGQQTQLNWPATLAMDQESDELYVANDAADSILVFRVTDDGDVAPLREIKGPHTQIKNPTGLSVDAKNDELWVSNMGNHRATVYPRTASGDVPPKRVIRSAPEEKLAMAIGNPGAVAYDGKRNEILVPN